MFSSHISHGYRIQVVVCTFGVRRWLAWVGGIDGLGNEQNDLIYEINIYFVLPNKTTDYVYDINRT